MTNTSSTSQKRPRILMIYTGGTIGMCAQDIGDPQAIVALTPYTRMLIGKRPEGITYAVTALDRQNRESDPVFLYNPD